MRRAVGNQVNAIGGLNLIGDDVKREGAERSGFAQAGHEPSGISEECNTWVKRAN